MQNFWFNLLDGKGGRKKPHEQWNIISIKTPGSLETRTVHILLFAVFSTVKLLLPVAKFRLYSSCNFVFWQVLKIWNYCQGGNWRGFFPINMLDVLDKRETYIS